MARSSLKRVVREIPIDEQRARRSRRRLSTGGSEGSAPSHETEVPTFARRLQAPSGTESIGYDLPETAQYLDYLSGKGRLSQDRLGRFRCPGVLWSLLLSIGILTGLVAISVDFSLHYMFLLRMRLNDLVVDAGASVLVQYVCFVGVCMGFAAVAGLLVCYVEPLAAGSGIPEIKCYLNGVRLPGVIGLRALAAKAIGIVFSVTSGLPCGKEGPMIHSGAIVGGVLMTKCHFARRVRPLILETEMRDMIAAGAAAGVAAAFGAPLGSVLFAIEEGASHMNPSIMLRLFVACAAATFVSRLFMSGFTGLPWGRLGNSVPVSFGRFENMDYNAWEMPVFALMGTGFGLLGALFNMINKRLTQWRSRHVGPRGTRRFLEVLLVTSLISSVQFVVPIIVHGGVAKLRIEEHDAENGRGRLSADPIDASSETLEGDYLSLTEQLFWQGGTTAMKALFHEPDHVFDWRLLLPFAIINFCLACLTYGLGVPSGLFVPSLLTGSAFGRLVGHAVHAVEDRIAPGGVVGVDLVAAPYGIYAFVGACGMLAGTARITISLAMILMEVTGDAEFGLPIFLVVMVAKIVGDKFTRGIYDMHIIDLKHVPILEHSPEPEMYSMQVRDVMAADVWTVEAVTTVETIMRVLRATSHHCYPVVHPGTLRLAGMVRRRTLHIVFQHGKEHGLFQDPAQTSGRTQMPPMIDFDAEASLPRITNRTELFEPTEKELVFRVDLRPYTNRNGYSMPEYSSVASCYTLFRQLGLRHLPILTCDGSVVGIITRKDLILDDHADDGVIPRTTSGLSDSDDEDEEDWAAEEDDEASDSGCSAGSVDFGGVGGL